jgi:hypothetical protein
MADPLGPTDDLLSSIRRLVVDDKGAGEPDSAGKLMLASDVRILRSVSRPKPAQALQPLHLHPATRVMRPSLQIVAAEADGVQPPVIHVQSETPTAGSLDDVHKAEDGHKKAPPVAEPQISAPQMSEQALRNLVRLLMREEFQSDLGLQITRSIRKLVKMEIARELDLRARD